MHPDLFRPEEQYPIELEEKPPKMPKLARVLLREAKKHEPADVARRATQIALRKQAKKEHPKRIRKLFGIGGGRRAVSLSEREAGVLAAAARGETPMFVELSSLTSAQIRELPRTAFTDEEWEQLDDDDREYIEENDTESKARVDDLADLFVSRYESERERGGGDDDNISEYFHDWLGQERDLYRLLPDRMYRGLVAYGDQNRVDETEVDAIINDYLSDPGRYDLGDRRRGQNSVWSWDVEGSVYVSGDDIAQRIDAMTADEIERAVEKISEETGGDVDPSAADLKRLATATPRGYRRDYEGESFTTGQTVYATIDWDDVDTAVRELIDEAAPQPDEDDEDDEIDIDKIEISGKVPKLPRPTQPVVYEWPDGTTMVDLNIEDDEVVSITEALGILGVPWDTMSANKDALKPMIVKGKIRPHGRDTDGMPTFLRGELAFGLESLELRHCVGWSNMGYMDAVRNGEIKILSMRHADPAKRPIFTIEAVLAGRSMLGSKATRKITGIDQIKGFTNSVPGFARGEQEQVDTPEKIDRLTASKTEKILKDFRRDEVQKIIEWVINPPVQRGLGLDPSKIEDLRPALNVVELLADREDPWGVALQAKLDAANQRDATPPEPTSPEPVRVVPLWAVVMATGVEHVFSAATEEEAYELAARAYPDENIAGIRRANPASSCEHGVCEGFCLPYRGRRNPSNPSPLMRDEAIQEFFRLLRDPDPASMQIAEDIVLELKLSLADLGESGAGREPGMLVSIGRFTLGSTESGPDLGLLLSSGPQSLNSSTFYAVGWEVRPRLYSGLQYQLYDVILMGWWRGIVTFAAPDRVAAIRTRQEARRAAAASAWFIAKRMKEWMADPVISNRALVDGLLRDAASTAADPTAPELYEHVSTRGPRGGEPKQQTYREAQDAILSALQRAGWALSARGRRIPYATSPSGMLRLWFKPQAVWFTAASHDYETKYVHVARDARSVSYDLDVRKMTPSEFIGYIADRWPAASR